MKNQFDELTKSMTQSVTRRDALKKFSIGLTGMALARFGLANKAEANACFNKCVHNCVDNLVAQGTPKDHATIMCKVPCAFACSGI